MSTVELRRRSNAATADRASASSHGGIGSSSAASSSTSSTRRGGLSAKALLESSPAHDGMVLKLHVPALYPFIPTCLQRLLASQWLNVLHLSPRWAERHLILLGKYCYRFTDTSASSPKGSPVPVEAINVHVCDRGDDDLDDMRFIWDYLPPGCSAIFTVSTFGKTQYFAVSTREEATTWVNSLREARQAAITRSMGHASHVPYPKYWEYYDGLGTSLVKQKDRIRKRLEESNMKQMEISSFSDAAGSMPRGYYG